jgi:hypothetical protein
VVDAVSEMPLAVLADPWQRMQVQIKEESEVNNQFAMTI